MQRRIGQIFKESRNNYGSRKIKHVLAKQGYTVSRRRIRRIMQEQGLVSSYTKAKYRPGPKGCNEASTPNLLDRQFNRKDALDVVVSDLTYVRIKETWCYVCLIIDLWNREIIGWSVGTHKDAKLVCNAIYRIPYRLDRLNIFHTDRGKEFDNQLITDVLAAFNITRSLSAKGCPYDNSVNEATNKILKTEFIYRYSFTSLDELEHSLADYIHWYNYERIHSSLNYQTPISLREQAQNYLFYQSLLK